MSFSKSEIKVDSLFEIGNDTNLLTGNEKAFYEDQRHAREWKLSEEMMKNMSLKNNNSWKKSKDIC